MILVQSDNAAIFGASGSGKTHLFKTKILPKLLKEDKRQMIILDLKNEYDGVIINSKQIKSPMQIAEIEVGKFTKDKKPKILVIKFPEFFQRATVEIVWEYLCRADNKLLIFEECYFYFKYYKHRELSPWCSRFIRTATLKHNNNNNVICISQYVLDIPSIFLAQLREKYVFYLEDFQLNYLHRAGFLPKKPDEFEFDWKNDKHKYYEL